MVRAHEVVAVLGEELVLDPVEGYRYMTTPIDVRVNLHAEIDHERLDASAIAIEGERQRLSGAQPLSVSDVMLVRIR
jgi:hypothetical protein